MDDAAKRAQRADTWRWLFWIGGLMGISSTLYVFNSGTGRPRSLAGDIRHAALGIGLGAVWSRGRAFGGLEKGSTYYLNNSFFPS
jgi:hypothetical protein